MNRAYRILPCYSGDVSGVCSALYELGGMVVIHDPSGCNSTYNTHDETRWFSQDSMIYLSGLSELDAILGSDRKLVDEISEAALSLQPEFIALASSPIPYLSGQDMYGIARLIEQRTNISCFYVTTNGMHDYIKGVQNAFLQLAERFVIESPKQKSRTVNILGLTPLDFGPTNAAQSLQQWLAQHGWTLQACWAMGSSLDALRMSAQAQVNLVVSASGLALAQLFKKRFGIPYVLGVPIGTETRRLETALETAVNTGTDQAPCRYRGEGSRTITLIGEPVTMGSLAAAIAEKYPVSTQVLCPLSVNSCLLAPADAQVLGEEAAESAFLESEMIIGDPMYRYISPDCAAFYSLPHQALSGRNGWKTAKNLITLEI